jgi:hypothetical protein
VDLFHYILGLNWGGGGNKEGMEPGGTLAMALYATSWALKFSFLEIFLASQREESEKLRKVSFMT